MGLWNRHCSSILPMFLKQFNFYFYIVTRSWCTKSIFWVQKQKDTVSSSTYADSTHIYYTFGSGVWGFPETPLGSIITQDSISSIFPSTGSCESHGFVMHVLGESLLTRKRSYSAAESSLSKPVILLESCGYIVGSWVWSLWCPGKGSVSSLGSFLEASLKKTKVSSKFSKFLKNLLASYSPLHFPFPLPLLFSLYASVP